MAAALQGMVLLFVWSLVACGAAAPSSGPEGSLEGGEWWAWVHASQLASKHDVQLSCRGGREREVLGGSYRCGGLL